MIKGNLQQLHVKDRNYKRDIIKYVIPSLYQELPNWTTQEQDRGFHSQFHTPTIWTSHVA